MKCLPQVLQCTLQYSSITILSILVKIRWHSISVFLSLGRRQRRCRFCPTQRHRRRMAHRWEGGKEQVVKNSPFLYCSGQNSNDFQTYSHDVASVSRLLLQHSAPASQLVTHSLPGLVPPAPTQKSNMYCTHSHQSQHHCPLRTPQGF